MKAGPDGSGFCYYELKLTVPLGRLDMLENQDLYEILQVHSSAHPEVIRVAYRRLAQLYHPDTNPSPEATDLMTRINQAYEVLRDPEKRASYDRSRGLDLSGESAVSHPPETPPRRRSRQPAPDYITIGSRKVDVIRVQGEPMETRITDDVSAEAEEIWSYGDDGYISFGTSGQYKERVKEWWNKGNLKVRIVPSSNITTEWFFSLGSHKDDVARLQGTPHRVVMPFRQSRKSIAFDREQKRFWQEQKKFDREFGIKFEDYPVDENLDEEKDRETWHYPEGVVEFSHSSGRVTAFRETGSSLKAQRVGRRSDVGWAGPDFFTIGSSQKDVKGVQGHPDRNDVKFAASIEEWRYDNSQVTFKLGWTSRVQEWKNINDKLKVRMVPGSNVTHSATFSLSSHKDDVIRLQGTPWQISVYEDLGYETWLFSGGTVVFSLSDSQVIYYETSDGSLKTKNIRSHDVGMNETLQRFHSNVRDTRRVKREGSERKNFRITLLVGVLLTTAIFACGYFT